MGEIIVGLTDAQLVNIDVNWHMDSLNILSPKKYEENSRDRITHLGVYIHNVYDESIILSLP